MSKLRKDAFESPSYHIAVIVLLALGLVLFPAETFLRFFIEDEHKAKLIGGTLLRAILSICMVFAIKKYKFTKPFFAHNGLKTFLLVIPALIIALNNFPLSAIAKGQVKFTTDGLNIALFLLYCISVGVFEELLFCGLVFPLCLYIYRYKKYSVVCATLVSSLIFALSHLLHLISGADLVETLYQVGYAFLVGAMFTVSKCVTRNIFTAIVLHTIYDIGGLMLSKEYGIGVGNQWDSLTIILTIVLGVIITIYMAILAVKVDHDEVEELYFDDGRNPAIDNTKETKTHKNCA